MIINLLYNVRLFFCIIAIFQNYTFLYPKLYPNPYQNVFWILYYTHEQSDIRKIEAPRIYRCLFWRYEKENFCLIQINRDSRGVNRDLWNRIGLGSLDKFACWINLNLLYNTRLFFCIKPIFQNYTFLYPKLYPNPYQNVFWILYYTHEQSNIRRIEHLEFPGVFFWRSEVKEKNFWLIHINGE